MKVVIAGGGTGGHLFPGIALAEEVVTRHPSNDVLFVGTARGIEARVVPQSGFKLELIDVTGVKGRGLKGLIGGLLRLPAAVLRCMTILREYQADVVVGVGGYASFPMVFAGFLRGMPTAIQEQNALPGLTNRLLGKIARTVFISFDEAARFFPKDKVHNVGNPIRKALMENFLRPQEPHERFRILIFGGSQGAHAINVAAIDAARKLAPMRDKLEILHQTGAADREFTRKGYADAGVRAEVVEFIDDMSRAYATSNLVICRSGATTLSELTVCKKAAILVPFPYAADNHQEVNARSLVEKGAAVMIRQPELDGERLASEISSLMEDPSRLKKMERAAGLLGRPEAAKEIADVCVNLVYRGREQGAG
ncbi:undecaprenyldiphospho-muramoylpentapeptide beta-N-acetylglucosaminyltransferase [Vulgatibacter incomptus]|uniref:UDP-N-acetylglucosamine--N-acetylmuramyl-(pentapeptide) pyrophosphoryl-undecaprenol N-acetylglucosamine transferase n=1 Tax=Vulgatibacter incomptus TaxID=1391653 RepID=A0A0K1PE98_9BACT|nr:UDP-NAG--NAM-(pentapeptide) pyrophosphoryl-undecaprenol NAG transferase [Vulgatibacter incomptus]